jgi:hypothetical protein
MTEKGLRRRIRQQVLGEAIPLWEAIAKSYWICWKQ